MDLLGEVLKQLLGRNHIDPALVEDVIAGCVTQGGTGRERHLAGGPCAEFPEVVPSLALLSAPSWVAPIGIPVFRDQYPVRGAGRRGRFRGLVLRRRVPGRGSGVRWPRSVRVLRCSASITSQSVLNASHNPAAVTPARTLASVPATVSLGVDPHGLDCSLYGRSEHA
jgi:hypothetical protein